jgi:hypothetical protein
MRGNAIALGLVAAAAALAAARVSAQELAPPAQTSFPGVAELIEEIHSSQGRNSPDLIGPLMNLGLTFREQGDVPLAAAAFERGRHLVRVNYGLSSFEEAPFLRQLIQIEEGLGNAAGAWRLEQELLVLIRRYPGPRAAPMLREIADKRVDVLQRYSAGEFPPQIMLGCYYAAVGSTDCPGSGTSFRVKQKLLNQARSYYYDTIDMVAESEGEFADEIPELYLGLARAIYAARSDYGAGAPPYYGSPNVEGREALRRILSLLVKGSKPLPAQVNALVQLADWDLLFAGGRQRNEAAFKSYETVYDLLIQRGLDQPSIDEIFSPRVPVVLPAFSPNPIEGVAAAGSVGFIDVAFEITKYGEGKSIEILTTNTPEAARLRLVDLIKRSRFRPRMADGAFEDPSRVVVRYYVNE